ncbi:MAG: Uma2 family endonuclease, partial [Planctomycetes bacterium]|nr:Uma2 family endonuclease [Planctomycetota bacterium]
TLDDAPPLQAGDRLTRERFLRIWKQHPEIKFAELIGGVVYMPSPLTRQYGVTDNGVSGWLWYYQVHTQGTEGGSNATTLMDDDEAPQPGDYLRILPEHGGQSGNQGKYVFGSPELIAEVSVSSASYDLNQKLELYERAGVQEYIAILLHEKEIRWHRLTNAGFNLLAPSAGTIWKSRVFPGLWLDGEAMLAADAATVLAVLQQGLQTPEHAAFVKKLARKRTRSEHEA